jgi:hypothetical protein
LCFSLSILTHSRHPLSTHFSTSSPHDWSNCIPLHPFSFGITYISSNVIPWQHVSWDTYTVTYNSSWRRCPPFPPLIPLHQPLKPSQPHSST